MDRVDSDFYTISPEEASKHKIICEQDKAIVFQSNYDKPIKVIFEGGEYDWNFTADDNFNIVVTKKLNPKEKEQLLESLFGGGEAYGLYGSEN